MSRGAVALLLLLACAGAPRLLAQEARYRHHDAALLPDSLETPGAVATTDTAAICR